MTQLNTQGVEVIEPGAGPVGTVFDIGYQAYTGAREGRNRGRIAVFKDGIRTALGLGRGGRAKVLPWLFILILTAIALVMAIMVGAINMFEGPEAAAGMPSHSDYYGFTATILFVFAAVVGPELLCPDRREGVINLYLVRPISGSDYIIARWAAFLAVMLGAAWLPQVILLVGRWMGAPEPFDYLGDNWADIPRFLLAGFVIAIYATTLALLTASFTTRRAYASVFLIGLLTITTPFTLALGDTIDGPVGQWILMFNLVGIPLNVTDLVFREVNLMTEEFDVLTGELPPSVIVAWYVAWTIVPGAFLWLRYRRMTP